MDDPNPPAKTVKLVFIHHSCGSNWLQDGDGNLGIALRDSNYFVSDTNYGWGPDGIGSSTDIGHWWSWFRGPSSSTYTAALYAESGQNSSYSRLGAALARVRFGEKARPLRSAPTGPRISGWWRR